jgi:ATP/maltotriose-dependent transcriptional regulator MalT
MNTDAYENMTWETPSDELEDAVENLLAEVKRLQSEPTVTVDDYHKKGHLYVTVHFPDGEQYVGLVEKWEGEEE